MIDLGAWASDVYSIAGKVLECDDALDTLLTPDSNTATNPARH